MAGVQDAQNGQEAGGGHPAGAAEPRWVVASVGSFGTAAAERLLHLSVTMSKTAPSVDVWLNIRAKRPSSSSHTKLQGRQRSQCFCFKGWEHRKESKFQIINLQYLKKYAKKHCVGSLKAIANAYRANPIRA